MEKRYRLSKEFFGGVIYDKKTRKNISIDKELYSLIEILLSHPINVPDIEMDSTEMVEILISLFKLDIFNSNIDILKHKTDNEYEDHLSAPFRIFYDITYECNLRCKHCFTNSGEKREAELTLSEKKDMVSQICELGTNRISIAGGEPFICPDLFPFIAYCRDKGIDVSLTTNGTLFTPSVISQINEYDLKNLTVSFDGGDKNSMELIRGKGSYDQVINGLQLLSQYYNYSYSIKTTLMKNNIYEIENIIKTAINYKCKTLKFNCVREDGRAIKNKNTIVLNNKEYVDVIKRIEEAKEKYKDKISIKAPLNIFCEDEYDYIDDLGFGCFAGKESLCINPLGDVKPCSHFPKEFICGNIKKNTLSDIWHNSSILYDFRHLKGNDKCNNCDQYEMCRAGCRFRAFKKGDINGVDPFCYLEA